MKKPYIVCHMMTSVDGRIDCGMTSKLRGVQEYYSALSTLNVSTTVSGRVTAELEMAMPGKFVPKNNEKLNAEGFSKKVDEEGYSVVVDTKGTLLWEDGNCGGTPLLIITSEQVSKEYITYLDEKNISWIACGKDRINLVKASMILADEFGVKRMATVGGGNINAGFLDEISILMAPGIDARGGMAAVFDGLPMNTEPVELNLESVMPYDNGALWIRYTTENRK